MKRALLAIACMLALHAISIDTLAQCGSIVGGTNNPYLQIKWANTSSVFDFGHKITGTNFDYTFDFGNVEQELSAAQQIQFFNCLASSVLPRPADQLLSNGQRFDIQMAYCGSAPADWDVTALVDAAPIIPAVPASNSSTPFNIIFKSSGTPGIREAILIITYNDPDQSVGNQIPAPNTAACYYTPAATNPATTITIKLKGTVVAPVPVNSILVVDRSGSMGDPAYTVTGSVPKISALQSAMEVYYSSMEDIDNYGVVKFSSTATPYVTWRSKGANPLPAELEPGATTGSGGLVPSGSTSIGDGLQKGVDMSNANASPAGYKNVLVLQTDGIQNTAPDVTSVSHDPSKVQIYTVGLGADVQDSYLIGISGPDRFFKVDNDITTNPARQDLMDFYFKIHSQANNMSMVVDPTKLVALSDTPVIAFTSTLTTADKAAAFFVIEGDNIRDLYKTELVNPAGDVITASSNIGGAPVRVEKLGDHIVYKVHGAIDNSFIGEWKLRVVPGGRCKEKGQPCNVPVTFSVSAKTNLTMEASSLSSTYLPGSAIAITTRLAEMRLPIKGASVVAEVTTPDNKVFSNIKLIDNGNGSYAAQFIETSVPGTYRIKMWSTVKTLKGETTTRESVRFVPLQFPNKIGQIPADVCFSCTWVRILIILGFLLLILIIRMIRSKK